MKLTSELKTYFAEAGAASRVVSVVCYLPSFVKTAAETKSLVDNWIELAEHLTREKPEIVNVFDNLGAFVVVASVSYMKVLLANPIIQRATPNQTS